MARTTTRKNEVVARYLAAAMLGVVTWLALRAMPFYPPWLEFALAITVGALAAFSASMASLLFVVVLSLPVMAADFLTGIAFLLVSLVATQYLSAGPAGGFLLTVLGVAAIPLHAEWVVVALAGYLLGRGKGALTAVAICLTAVAAGMALGTPVLGTLATGGTAPGFVVFTAAPEGALGFGWLVPALKAADTGRVLTSLGAVEHPALLLAQTALWALAGILGALTRRPRTPALAFAGPVGAVIALAVGGVALDTVLGGPVPATAFTTTTAVSLPLTLAATAIALRAFPERPIAIAAPAQPPIAGPRDVDDLLRTIASAEDELAARHNSHAVVLITDMKSFSAMTEELGSVQSAKIVQRHRDLLLPIIAANGGRGAPTGGDGLVAAFDSPTAAVAAAAAMQRALEGYTGSDRSPHELSVRVGIASGEVVLDTAGCPFLGAALNLAARVMDLADGGRVMMTGEVADGSAVPPAQLHAHGEFKLKNIAEAVPVVELLWRDPMDPQEIRAS